ncbi:MAG: OmpA family protein [Acidobacteria bacterium]|nr:OmpA family protein [Acidobacteriota bacterium]
MSKWGGCFLMAIGLAAQVPNPTQRTSPDPQNPMPVFRVTVVSRVAKAVNFHHRQGWTTMDLKPVMGPARSKGEVRVDSKTGATRVDARINKMPPPSSFGSEYLTYVLWAITPEGRPQNLGELLIDGDDDAKLQAATELQAFGLIVTAEPYYAVTQPSDMIIMEAVQGSGTTGTLSPIEVKYELQERGAYFAQLPPGDRVKITDRRNIPIDLMEARHAYNIARSFGAEQYAADTIAKARVELQNAEDYFRRKSGDKKKIQTLARNVTQTAEDARIISVRKQEAERLEAERRRKDAEVASAQAEAERSAREREAAQRQAEQSRIAAERAALEQARAEAEKAKSAADADGARRLAAEQAEAARRAGEQAEAARRQAAEALAERARLNAERLAAREALRKQLSLALETRETARGLIMNMPDVLFAFDKYDLTSDAKVRLAKVSGVIATQQKLKIEVEGHTDSIGSDEYNYRLSDNRANAVRSFLVSQGVPVETITSKGFGKSKPIADNSTNFGRSKNRRVELVVSGEAITPITDITITTTTTNR